MAQSRLKYSVTVLIIYKSEFKSLKDYILNIDETYPYLYV